MSIPIQNVYFLLCYAWGHLPVGSMADVGSEESPDLQNLLAKALLHGTRHLLRRGLYRHYVETSEDTRRPRGRIKFEEGIRRSLKRRGQVHCVIDELSEDVPPNQLIKTTIGRLVRLNSLDGALTRDLRVLHRQLHGISEVPLSAGAFRRVQVHSNNAYYRFLLHICALLHAQMLPQDGGQGFSFVDILDDEVRMEQIFEEFVRNFYKLEQTAYRLGPRSIAWDCDWVDDDAQDLLPGMVNDIRLDGSAETILIDTKYYKSALATYHGRQRFKSENLYQLFAYLRNLSATAETKPLRGILLYPTAATAVNAALSIQGFPVQVVTLNLDQPWHQIRQDLLSLLAPVSAPPAVDQLSLLH